MNRRTPKIEKLLTKSTSQKSAPKDQRAPKGPPNKDTPKSGLRASVCSSSFLQVRKNSLNIKFLGGIFLGHPGPRRRDIPDKNFMQVAFFCCFRQGVAGMSRDLGRDVPDLEKLYARKLWADFSYPIPSPHEAAVWPSLARQRPLPKTSV